MWLSHPSFNGVLSCQARNPRKIDQQFSSYPYTVSLNPSRPTSFFSCCHFVSVLPWYFFVVLKLFTLLPRLVLGLLTLPGIEFEFQSPKLFFNSTSIFPVREFQEFFCRATVGEKLVWLRSEAAGGREQGRGKKNFKSRKYIGRKELGDKAGYRLHFISFHLLQG